MMKNKIAAAVGMILLVCINCGTAAKMRSARSRADESRGLEDFLNFSLFVSSPTYFELEFWENRGVTVIVTDDKFVGPPSPIAH
jgi:hypothetical protein